MIIAITHYLRDLRLESKENVEKVNRYSFYDSFQNLSETNQFVIYVSFGMSCICESNQFTNALCPPLVQICDAIQKEMQ